MSNDPWSTTGAETAEPSSSTDPWGGAGDAATSSSGGDAWGNATSGGSADFLRADQVEPPAFDIMHPFQDASIPLEGWVENGLDWLVSNFRPFFQAVRWPIDATLSGVETGLSSAPAFLVIIVFALLAWQVAGKRLAIGTTISLVFIGLIGAWNEAMVTLSLVITSVVFCMVIGLPLGILLGRSDRASTTVRPILDAMQTTPAFVYLVPIVMLFGIGNVPGVVVTIIFSLPPLVRLTSLGIRQVPADLVEAAHSFGASPRQLLFKVQLPLAMPTIMAGVNQTLMLALSMVVIASMIAVGGLGQMVLRGIGRLDMGLATVGGLAIVLLAIVLDRMTQAMGHDKRQKGVRHWYESGPAYYIRKLLKR
jgi:glycine betaine/proline transport system permease protein